MKPLVLIVDDERSMTRLMLEVLQAKGLRAVAAHTAEEGLRIARDLRPDLILMDLRMRGVNGCAATMSLREDPELAFVPIVLVSASPPETLEILAGEAGANDVLSKPFGLAQFLDVVRKWTQREASR